MIRHYAGDVTYNVAGMTDKNKDALIKDILDLVDASKDQFLHTLFPDRPDPDSKKRPPTAGDKIKVRREPGSGISAGIADAIAYLTVFGKCSC